ncbi:uncharacterized protein LOC111136345 [Crassostrea virginica]
MPKIRCKGDTSYTQKVSILGTYLKYRLIAVCDLKDLRNTMRLHSKSLQKLATKDHFERVINMQSSEDDLRMLDLNLVYNLLVNFSDIQEPLSGWGNIPDNADMSQGADIERIKIIVNNYFDGFYCDHADEIFKRWTEYYGEINPSDVIYLSTESEINYLKIKPDCFKKSGVVVTRAIENILEKMKLSNIVIGRGAIGCGKTTVLDYVTREYRDEGWQIEWVEEFIDDSCIDRVKVPNSNRTILCCDNYCGSFGCHMFSQDVLARNERTIGELFSCGKVIKVLIGIHNHVYDEINSTIGHQCFLQNNNSFVDLDKLSESELLWIYKTQEERDTTKQETKSYEDLLTMTKRRSGLVGVPFQTMMMHALPDICFSESFCNDPFQIITEHFKMLSRQDKQKFDSLLYIMCAMIFDQKAEQLDQRVASAISKDLDVHWVKYYVKEFASYVKIENNCVELKHELIAIAVFHTFLEVFRNPWSIFTACDIRKTLELIRPQDENQYHPFAVPISRVSFESIRLTLEPRISKANMNMEGHSLMKYFNEKGR